MRGIRTVRTLSNIDTAEFEKILSDKLLQKLWPELEYDSGLIKDFVM